MALRPNSLNIISLCTGGGGLDRAVELAIPSARAIACVEREAFAVANLVSQMQRGIMAPAPIHGDVRTFPGRRFRGGVDGVIGGIPCQPYSLAGKRLGRNDERDLWGAARRIFVQSGAWFVLIENVGGMLSEGGAERVRGDLLRLGCKVAGGLFRASEVGLPHERERLFILGVADRDGVDGYRRGVFGTGWRGQPANGGDWLADTHGERLQGFGANASPQGREDARGPAGLCDGAVLEHAPGERRGEGRPEPVIRRGRRPAALADGQLAHANCTGPAQVGGDAREVGVLPEAERQPKHGAALSGRGSGAVADARRIGDQRRREPVEFPCTAGAAESQPEERQRGWDAADDRLNAVADSDLAIVRGQPPAGEQPVLQLDHGVGGAASAELDDAAGDDGRLHQGRGLQGFGAPDSGGAGEMADTLGGGCVGRPCEPVWSEEERAALEWASSGPLLAAGPGDIDAWRWIMERVPERLPAVSRRDLFLHALRKTRAVAHRDPEARGDLDPQGPFGLRASVVQALAESHLRRGSHGLAPRIDQLRMLGNGVVDLEGAYAVRSIATDLSPRSAGAAELVRLMALPDQRAAA